MHRLLVNKPRHEPPTKGESSSELFLLLVLKGTKALFHNKSPLCLDLDASTNECPMVISLRPLLPKSIENLFHHFLHHKLFDHYNTFSLQILRIDILINNDFPLVSEFVPFLSIF